MSDAYIEGITVRMPGWGPSESVSDYDFQMDTPFGRYTVTTRGEYGFGWKRPAHPPFMGLCSTLKQAQDAAEIDYVERIESALIY